MLIANLGLTIATWLVTPLWFIFVPIVGAANFVNSVMVVVLLGWYVQQTLKTILFPRSRQALDLEKGKKFSSKTLAFVVPCYSESKEEITSTLDSLVEQSGLDVHKRLLVVICDGRVKAADAAKETNQILFEDIFDYDSKEVVVNTHDNFDRGYQSWTRHYVGIETRTGTYRGVPFMVVVKSSNHGKRDSLIFLRVLLHKFNLRTHARQTPFSEAFLTFFHTTCGTFGIHHFDFVVGADADTTFHPKCTSEMMKKAMERDNIVGVTGIVRCRFKPGQAGFWSLFQHAEYLKSQALRRLHQSEITHQVTCLPGACQLFKVRESTCGDTLMRYLFGYYPQDRDGLITAVRAFGGEDRNHMALIFTLTPYETSRMVWTAHAFTDPPQNFKVFLSQRRRWSLSSMTNNIITVFGRGQNLWERICSFVDLMNWTLHFFILGTLAHFISAVISHTGWIMLVALSSLVVIPWLYTIVSISWMPINGTERARYALGIAMLIFVSAAMDCFVIVYTALHMTDYSWGKTREVAKEYEGATHVPAGAEETLILPNDAEPAAAQVNLAPSHDLEPSAARVAVPVPPRRESEDRVEIEELSSDQSTSSHDSHNSEWARVSELFRDSRFARHSTRYEQRYPSESESGHSTNIPDTPASSVHPVDMSEAAASLERYFTYDKLLKQLSNYTEGSSEKVVAASVAPPSKVTVSDPTNVGPPGTSYIGTF